jgi:hypothetical protein
VTAWADRISEDARWQGVQAAIAHEQRHQDAAEIAAVESPQPKPAAEPLPGRSCRGGA